MVNRRRQGEVTLEDSVGSGFIWDERGYIVTNYHCVQPVLQDQTNKLVPLTSLPLGQRNPPLAFVPPVLACLNVNSY